MDMDYKQAMATADGYAHRAALAAAFGDFDTRAALEAKATEYRTYADTMEQEY